MALFDVLASIFTAGAFGMTRATAGLPQAEKSKLTRLAAQKEELDRLQKVISGANRGQYERGQAGETCSDDFDCAGLPLFQLQDGFLLETVTGRVWRYDKQSDAFIELRFLSSPAGERVSPDVLANQIQLTEDQIEHVLGDIPDQQKQAVRSALEENYKKVLVWGLVQSRALTAETSTMAAR